MSFYGKTKAAAEENYEEAKMNICKANAAFNHGIVPDSNVTFKTWAEKVVRDLQIWEHTGYHL